MVRICDKQHRSHFFVVNYKPTRFLCVVLRVESFDYKVSNLKFLK